jgi:universal stress protein E
MGSAAGRLNPVPDGMNRSASILCVVDPTVRSGGAAIARAAAVALKCGAALELLICQVPLSSSGDDAVLSRRLDELAAPLRAQGTSVVTRLILGDSLPRALLEYIQASRFDLIVKGTHPHSLTQRVFGLNTDYHLIRASEVPVLFTRGRAWKAHPVVLACIDPSHPRDTQATLDRCILSAAQAFAGRVGGTLHAFHAYDHAIPAAVTRGESLAAALSYDPMENEATCRLTRVAALAKEFHIDPGHLHVCSAWATEGILSCALDHQVDMVVMGALSRGKASAAILGCVAEHVFERIRCDVLVVR